jgi:hypothetical protein
MLFARLFVPPSDGRSVMVYCCRCCDAANNPQPTPIRRIDKGSLTNLQYVEVCVFMRRILRAESQNLHSRFACLMQTTLGQLRV